MNKGRREKGRDKGEGSRRTERSRWKGRKGGKESTGRGMEEREKVCVYPLAASYYVVVMVMTMMVVMVIVVVISIDRRLVAPKSLFFSPSFMCLLSLVIPSFPPSLTVSQFSPSHHLHHRHVFGFFPLGVFCLRPFHHHHYYYHHHHHHHHYFHPAEWLPFCVLCTRVIALFLCFYLLPLFSYLFCH